MRPETLLPYAAPDYAEPTKEEVREALELGKLTGAAAGRLVGVTDRTVRKWTAGDQTIPYAAWRLLLIEIGKVTMNQAYFVRGSAKVRLTGFARIVDETGAIVREIDLADLGELTAQIDSVDNIFGDERCGIRFRIDDVFAAAGR